MLKNSDYKGVAKVYFLPHDNCLQDIKHYVLYRGYDGNCGSLRREQYVRWELRRDYVSYEPLSEMGIWENLNLAEADQLEEKLKAKGYICWSDTEYKLTHYIDAKSLLDWFVYNFELCKGWHGKVVYPIQNSGKPVVDSIMMLDVAKRLYNGKNDEMWPIVCKLSQLIIEGLEKYPDRYPGRSCASVAMMVQYAGCSGLIDTFASSIDAALMRAR